MKNLSLKSETLIDLSAVELSAVGGGAPDITGACVLTSFSACVSVDNCVTTNCTWSLVCG